MTGQATSAGGGDRLRPVPGHAKGVVLLEVVFSLALFSMGAMVVLAGLNTALRTMQRVQLEAEAADLAVTMLSEVQMGQVPLVDDGPRAFEDEGLTDWTWQITTLPVQQQMGMELPAAKQVEIIIRKTGTPFVYRLTELVSEEPLGGTGTGTDGTAAGDGQGGSGDPGAATPGRSTPAPEGTP